MWKLIHPFALCIIQSLPESIHYDLIDTINLLIPLGISWSGMPIRDTQFTTVFSEGFAIKLKSVVWDEGMRNLKLSDNVLPNKPFGIHVHNVRQWLSFNPLGKVISIDQKPSPVSCYFGEEPHNVQTLLRESLTLVTLLHVFLCFSLHIGPPISLSKGPVRQRSASYMASTYIFVQLFQEWLHCFRMDAQQIWPRKRVFVQLLVLGQPKSGSLSSHFVNLLLFLG